MIDYTVILMRPEYMMADTNDMHERSTIAWVSGATVEEAFGRAQDQARSSDSYPSTTADEYQVIAVFAGHINDLFIV